MTNRMTNRTEIYEAARELDELAGQARRKLESAAAEREAAAAAIASYRLPRMPGDWRD